MTIQEFSDQFDVLYNNITSNQAPGLNEYEKSVFLTKAQEEILKNYFSPKGNTKQEGFDNSRKRQADFSTLIKSEKIEGSDREDPEDIFDHRAVVFNLPEGVFIIVNENVTVATSPITYLTVVPLQYGEYDRLMAKPYKFPPKYQAWRLITGIDQITRNTSVENPSRPELSPITVPAHHSYTAPRVEILSKLTYTFKDEERYDEMVYNIRYLKRPNPIILEDFGDSVSINGQSDKSTKCELPEELHDEVLQRAVELAKAAWVGDQNTSANLQSIMTMGQRSE